MRKIHMVLTLMAVLAAQPVLAADMMDDSTADKSCGVVAKACKAAGFGKGEKDGKRFWFDCMRPVLLGQTVTGVTLNASDVKDCREHKIEHMKQEITDLEKASK